MHGRRSLGIFFLFVLFSGLASASDFYSYAQGSIQACACEISEGSLFVRNTGAVESIYSVSAGGLASDFTTLYPAQFSLPSREGITVSEFVSAPCASTGTYELLVAIRSEDGIVKSLSQDVDVVGCQRYSVYSVAKESNPCPCESFAYVYRIRNTGGFSDTFDFGVDHPDAVVVPASLRLAPGGEAEFAVLFRPDCSLRPGQFFLSVSAQGSAFTGYTPFVVNFSESCPAANESAVPKETRPSEFPFWVLVVLMWWLFVILVILALLLRRRRAAPKVKDERPYYWEKKFEEPGVRQAPAERKVRLSGWDVLKLLAAVFVVLLVVFLLYRFSPAFSGRNESSSGDSNFSAFPGINWSRLSESLPRLNFSRNASPPPPAQEGSAITSYVAPEGAGSAGNQSGNQSALPAAARFVGSWLKDYWMFVVAGLVILLVVIGVLEFVRRRPKGSA